MTAASLCPQSELSKHPGPICFIPQFGTGSNDRGGWGVQCDSGDVEVASVDAYSKKATEATQTYYDSAAT